MKKDNKQKDKEKRPVGDEERDDEAGEEKGVK